MAEQCNPGTSRSGGFGGGGPGGGQVGSGRAAGPEYSCSVVGAEEGAGAAHRADRKEWTRCGARSA